jgi:hypothetical protein
LDDFGFFGPQIGTRFLFVSGMRNRAPKKDTPITALPTMHGNINAREREC